MPKTASNHGVKWGGVDSRPQVFGAKILRKRRDTRPRIKIHKSKTMFLLPKEYLP
jgi:hypothetical protein